MSPPCPPHDQSTRCYASCNFWFSVLSLFVLSSAWSRTAGLWKISRAFSRKNLSPATPLSCIVFRNGLSRLLLPLKDVKMNDINKKRTSFLHRFLSHQYRNELLFFLDKSTKRLKFCWFSKKRRLTLTYKPLFFLSLNFVHINFSYKQDNIVKYYEKLCRL